MNISGWLGNQLWLGRGCDAAIADSALAMSRQRTQWNEVFSLKARRFAMHSRYDAHFAAARFPMLAALRDRRHR